MTTTAKTSPSTSNGKLLGLAWNQDFSCFSAALENGYRVFGTQPLEEKTRKSFTDGGFALVEMLYRCNFLALVGGGKNPCFPPNKVVIWDDQVNEEVCSISFKSEVKRVRLRRDRLIVATSNRAFVYTLTKEPRKLQEYTTMDNPLGLCALSPSAARPIVALLGLKAGQVQVVDLGKMEQLPLIIAAHETSIACLALNQDGTLLATASKRGTLIRVFDCVTGKKRYEVRRGSEQASIQSISFNLTSTYLCASSDHGTVHVFTLQSSEDKPSSGLTNFLPDYFSSQWSFAKFSVSSRRCICAFAGENEVLAICFDGTVYRATFSEKGDVRVEHLNVLQYVYDGPEGGDGSSDNGTIDGDDCDDNNNNNNNDSDDDVFTGYNSNDDDDGDDNNGSRNQKRHHRPVPKRVDGTDSSHQPHKGVDGAHGITTSNNNNNMVDRS